MPIDTRRDENQFAHISSKRHDCQTDLDVSVHGGGLGGPDQPLQLRPAEIFGISCQLWYVDILREQVEALHLVGVNGENLNATFLIGKTWSATR